MFERKHQPVISRHDFAERLMRTGGIALIVMAVSLLVGILGYRALEKQTWVDALLNASMILGGMGPVNELHTTAGKIFASLYALYSGLILIVVGGLFLAPVFHRVLHAFHQEE